MNMKNNQISEKKFLFCFFRPISNFLLLLLKDKIPIFQSRASLSLTVSTIVCMAVGCALPYIPTLNDWYGMTPLPGLYWPYLLADLTAYCVVSQIAKLIYIRVFHEWM